MEVAGPKALVAIISLAYKAVLLIPFIGHLKSDHRMDRCRYKGSTGDTVNVVWATLAWNTKKIAHLHRKKEEKQVERKMKRAA